jgi:hypothetical protein
MYFVETIYRTQIEMLKISNFLQKLYVLIRSKTILAFEKNKVGFPLYFIHGSIQHDINYNIVPNGN